MGEELSIFQNGHIIHRGSADMEGQLAGTLFALKLLNEEYITFASNVIFQSKIGKEITVM